ncbi:MAG: WD40 repeat domain-containing protein, partial [Cytophagales bacterium]|nr:WD40 repeat domain-containing protein [Armatimonadota bacterium]
MKTENDPTITGAITDEEAVTLTALLSEAYPAQIPSAALRARVAAHAARAGKRSDGGVVSVTERTQTRWRRPAVLRWGTAVAAAFAVSTAAVVAWPQWVAAKALQRMEVAIGDVRNAHTVFWDFAPDGTPAKKRESWFQGSSVRSEETEQAPGGEARLKQVQLYANGKYWTYSPQENQVTFRRKDGFAHYNASGFSIAAMQHDYARWGWKDKIRVLGETIVEGRAARQVTIEKEEPAGETRLRILADPKTDLPFRMEMRLKTEAGWRTMFTGEMRYNTPLDTARVFVPDFPRAARRMDLDAEQAHLRERLAQGLAEKSASGSRRVVLRDLRVNKEGDVFLLYTAGKRLGDAFGSGLCWAGRDWTVTVTDDLGNRYVPHANRLLSGDPLPGEELSALVYGGERLEGEAWTPEAHQRSPWRPRQFTITFHLDPRNLHGDHGTDTKAQLSETVTFFLPVRHPNTALVPDYSSVFRLDLGAKRLREVQAEVRGELPPGVTPSKELLLTLPDSQGSVSSIAFSPDGRRLATAAWASGIHLWELETGRNLGSWSTETLRNTGSVAFSPDGRYLTATSAEFQNKKLVRTDLQVRDLRARGRVLWEDSVPSKNNEGWLGPLVFSSDGTTVMTHTTRSDVVESTVYGESTKEMSARIISWDSRTGKPSLKTPYFGRQSLFRAALAPPLNSLVTWRGNLAKAEGGQTVTSSTLQVWDAQTG